MSTLVQIKRSSSNVSPTTLLEGELAYSFLSNTLFIGNTTNAVINIGGSYYTNKLDLASFANSASTLVLRAANGSSQFSQLDILVSPTANSHVATKQYVDGVISNAVFANATLAGLTDVNIGSAFANQSGKILIGNTSGYFVGRSVTGNVRISETGVFVIGASQVQNSMLNNSSVVINAGSGLIGGGSVSLGGSITLNVSNVENSMLNNSTVTINAGNGLNGGGIVPLGGSLTLNVSNVENSLLNNSTVTINAGDGLSGGGTVSLGNSLTIHVNAGDGISNSNDQVSVNSTVVRNDRSQTLNGTITFANTVNFNNGINVTGNVNIQGNTTLINVTTLNVSDPLIYLAANNSINDIVDIGFLGGKNTAGFYSHTGLVRHAADGIWYLFDNLVEESAESNVVDVANTTYALLRANIEAKQLNVTGAGSYANISSLILGTPLLVGSGGTGLTSFTANGVLYANTSYSLNFATGTEGQTLQIKSGVPTFDNVAVVPPSNTFATINANGTLIVAGSNNDILRIIAGIGTFVTANSGNNTITIGAQLNDTFTSTSTTQAATANVVNTIYSIANTAYTQSLAANLTVKEIVTSNNNQVINSYSSITTIQFDSDSGLAVIDESNNTVTIQLNSTFKFWQVNNNPGLIAVGLDTVNFITGYGIEISANNANTPKSITFSAPLIGTVYDSANNRVLRSGDTMTGDLTVNGTVAATTKSFIINHPSKPGMKLRYGSLEGPENGVYVRGILRGGSIIELPDYWLELVDENSITALLTPIKKYQKLYVKEIKDNKVFVGNDSFFGGINCSYIVYGERKDVEKLRVEY